MKRWEVGSEFYWSEQFLRSASTHASTQWLPANHKLFSTGTACLFALQQSLAENSRKRIHLPSFYCMDVASRLQKIFDICWYRDLPTQPTADFDSLQTNSGDIVMALNLYGIRSGTAWQDWHQGHNNVVLLEDHSHDPFSKWALHSTADYAFASLRKTIPIPDGGVLWSPRNHFLCEAWGREPPGTSKRLKAMQLKQQYLNGEAVEKEQYRKLEIASQSEMGYEGDNLVSDFTVAQLPLLDIDRMRNRKSANIRKFISLANDNSSQKWKPLFDQWDPGAVPLNAVILCKDEPTRNQIRAELITQNIYTAVHWIQPNHDMSSGDAETIALTERVLTIPLDARYDFKDVERVFEILSNC